mmetsp:Transcript_16074/g.38584  ORF Transcript_16074/g.38584 Transcript_16074/m.38584 type:complete len:153 (-) Transcript_16074:284-742(-)
MMMAFSRIAPSSITLCLLTIILARPTCHADAFVCHDRNRALIRQSSSRARRSQSFPSIMSYTPIAHVALFSEKDDNDKREKTTKERHYTRVEDGSPLGVAIVALGSLVIFGSEQDESLGSPDSSSVWIVFATASIAAGVARLIRYYSRDENE